MPTIEVLIGMIASGKSTYALKRARSGVLVVCHDDLTEMMHAEYRYERTPEMRALYRASEEALVRLFLAAGKDIVVDRTHLTYESRARWVNFARSEHIPIVAVVFTIEHPSVHAVRRFTHDHRRRTLEEWYDVAAMHAQQARDEPFDAEKEGFLDVIRPKKGELI